MRTAIITLIAGISFLLLAGITRADSPITSTHFSDAYMDIDIVQTAADSGVMTLEIAGYLASPDNPIDVKAAVINALSWDFNGKRNMELFCCYLALKYQTPMDELDLFTMDSDDMFCVGYLAVMDNYFEPQNGIPLLDEAFYWEGGSFTYAIILALAKAQNVMDSDFCEVWRLAEEVFEDRKLDQDMRPDAVNIIYDYMSGYEEYCD